MLPTPSGTIDGPSGLLLLYDEAKCENAPTPVPRGRPSTTVAVVSSKQVADLSGGADHQVEDSVLALLAAGNLHPLIAMLQDGEVGPERARAALSALGELDPNFLVQIALDSLITEHLVDPRLAQQPNREIRSERPKA